MNSIEFEIYQLGVYCDTVYMLMKKHSDLSLLKLTFFSYVINKDRFLNENVYNARNKKDIICKEISMINGDFAGFADTVPYILRSIHILNCAGIVGIDGDIVHLLSDNYKYIERNKESAFAIKVIEASKSWTDIRFLKEVLHNV